MKKQHIVIVLILAAIILAIAALAFFRNATTPNNTQEVVAPTEEPLDVVTEFYNEWVSTLNSTSTTIETSNLLDSPILSAELKTKIAEARNNQADDALDPVTCQAAVPERMGGKVLFTEPTNAQLMMLARGFEEKSPFQAVVTVTAVDGKWQIADITCAQGEVAPEREYDFEKEGFLLKSVPPPLDPNVWHLVYEENGQMGRTVPLTITAQSVCIQPDGSESTCSESMFADATKVYLQADMAETGATIRRLEFRTQ